MKKAILYARFSPRRNAEESESIETQLELCRAYCAHQKIEIAGEYFDRALSGASADRPGLWCAVGILRRGDTLVVYRLDRLARSVFLSHIIQRAVEKAGARIASASGEGTWSDTPEDALIRNILIALAEYERKVIATRTQVAMLRHQAKGRKMSHVCPYGWQDDPDRPGYMVGNDEERGVIRLIIEQHEAGRSPAAIGAWLVAQGITCRGRIVWHRRSISRILKREVSPESVVHPSENAS